MVEIKVSTEGTKGPKTSGGKKFKKQQKKKVVIYL